jgi:hypothetical protein
MDVQDNELIEIWRNFSKFDLKYIMVGGFAVNLHGFSRTTGDIDIWIKDTKINRQSLRKVLKSLGYADLPQLETIDFVPGWTTFVLDNSVELDVMTHISGFKQADFDECFEYSSFAKIAGLEVPFLHINQLIEAKKATNRPKDQIDIIELERIRKSR